MRAIVIAAFLLLRADALAALVTSPGCDDAVSEAVTDARLTDPSVSWHFCATFVLAPR